MKLVTHTIDITTASPPEANELQRYSPTQPVEKSFRDGLAYLVFKWTLFAQLIYTDMKLAYTKDVPIAATDATTIFLNPEGFEANGITDVLEIVFVLAHEVCHRIFNDLVLAIVWRTTKQVLCPSGKVYPYYHEVMNAAQDYRINAMLVHAGIGRMPKVGLYDPSISAQGMESCTEIYEKLLKSGRVQFVDGFDVHLKPGKAELDKDKGGAREQGIVAAAQLAERTNPGTMPAAIRRIIDDIVDPKVPWDRHLKTLMTRNAGTPKLDWRYQNRRLASRHPPMYFAKKGWNGAGIIAIGADNSGSICDPKMINRFASEMAGIVASLRPLKLVVLWCDTKITRVDELDSPDDLVDLFAKWKNDGVGGGGGTSFVPVFDELDKMGIVPDSLVYFTDGYGSFPKDEPAYNVIWASITKDMKYPFGDVVEVEV
jgi:predicted metal-dependent peptidase